MATYDDRLPRLTLKAGRRVGKAEAIGGPGFHWRGPSSDRAQILLEIRRDDRPR